MFTLRRVLATSWDATGKLKPIWDRLGVANGRDRLAELTGIQPTNLSSYNSGRRPLTREMAERIVAVVPGVSLLDLGALEAAAGEPAQTVLDRLLSLEAGLVESVETQAKLARKVSRLQARVRQLEALQAPARAETAAG